MTKYHVNDNGNAAPCKSTQGRCPFGSDADHHETAEYARAAYEHRMTASPETIHWPTLLPLSLPTDLKQPRTILSGHDGNAYSILGLVSRELRRAGNSQAVIDGYEKVAKADDYEWLLFTSASYLGSEEWELDQDFAVKHLPATHWTNDNPSVLNLQQVKKAYANGLARNRKKVQRDLELLQKDNGRLQTVLNSVASSLKPLDAVLAEELANRGVGLADVSAQKELNGELRAVLAEHYDSVPATDKARITKALKATGGEV